MSKITDKWRRKVQATIAAKIMGVLKVSSSEALQAAEAIYHQIYGYNLTILKEVPPEEFKLLPPSLQKWLEDDNNEGREPTIEEIQKL